MGEVTTEIKLSELCVILFIPRTSANKEGTAINFSHCLRRGKERKLEITFEKNRT